MAIDDSDLTTMRLRSSTSKVTIIGQCQQRAPTRMHPTADSHKADLILDRYGDRRFRSDDDAPPVLHFQGHNHWTVPTARSNQDASDGRFAQSGSDIRPIWR